MLYTLPFEGQNQIFSIYGWRDLNGDGKYDNKHGGWDIRPPKQNGVVPTKKAQWPCDGKIDWVWNCQTVNSSSGNDSYGIARRIITPENGIYLLQAHMASAAKSSGDVKAGDIAGTYGPRTTGNSGGVHDHVEIRVGGTASTYRKCPGSVFGLTNTKDVTYDREKMDELCIGYLDCMESDYQWRTGPGTSHEPYKDANNGSKMYTIKGVTYRVYDIRTVDGVKWCQITPGPECITNGKATVCWVSSKCGTLTAKAIKLRYMSIGPLSSGDFSKVSSYLNSLSVNWKEL